MGRTKKFDEEFINRAIELTELSERPRCQVAKDLGVSDTTLGKWMRRSKNTDNTRLTRTERDELLQLRKEKREWLMEREILKKATAFWVKESKQ